MYKLYLTVWFLFSVVLTGSAYEMRAWETVDGEQYKGRFLRELFGKLTIEGEDGRIMTFKQDELSELDQRYLRVNVPPKIEVEVRSKSTSIEPRPMTRIIREHFIDEYQVTVRITKKSQRPFTSSLRAEIFLVAEEVEGDHYILLNRTEEKFLMPTISKGSEVELKSGRARTEKFRDRMSMAFKGEDYAGYLLVISRPDGEIVLTDSNLPSWMEEPQVIDNLRELSITGAPSVRSRHFDKTGRKVPPPRPRHRGPSSQ